MSYIFPKVATILNGRICVICSCEEQKESLLFSYHSLRDAVLSFFPPCSRLVRNTVLIFFLWGYTPSILSLQISANPHPVKSNPEVRLSVWASWVISFQNFKQSYFPTGRLTACALLALCENTNPCVSVRCENCLTKTGKPAASQNFHLNALVITWQSCSVRSTQMHMMKHLWWFSHTISTPPVTRLSPIF